MGPIKSYQQKQNQTGGLSLFLWAEFFVICWCQPVEQMAAWPNGQQEVTTATRGPICDMVRRMKEYQVWRENQLRSDTNLTCHGSSVSLRLLQSVDSSRIHDISDTDDERDDRWQQPRFAEDRIRYQGRKRQELVHECRYNT